MSKESSSVPPEPTQLIVCGWDEVFVWTFDCLSKSCPRKTWSWRASQRPDLPPALWGRFCTTDECKPVDHGRRILITSSGGAAALVDREHDRVLFYAHAPNAHSAETLPEGRLVVACSHHGDGDGDRLLLFDRAGPDRPCGSAPLPCAHGVVWDSARQNLYALGRDDLRIYSLEGWSSAAPELRLARTIQLPMRVSLPDECGHDLYQVPGTRMLSVTTQRATWHFDRDTEIFHPHPLLPDQARVKSLCHHPDGAVVYVQGEEAHWWSEFIHFRNPDRTLSVPGEHFYKARWITGTEP
jgi:hypothetical protein